MGKLASAWETIVGRNPKQAVIENLRHFKALAETGEIPRTQGQPTATGDDRWHQEVDVRRGDHDAARVESQSKLRRKQFFTLSSEWSQVMKALCWMGTVRWRFTTSAIRRS